MATDILKIGVSSVVERSTDEMRNQLQACEDIHTYIDQNSDQFIDINLAQYVQQMLAQKGRVKAQVVRESGLNTVYAYQILAGQKKPHRDKLLCVAFAMGLTEKETERLLHLAGCAKLYPKNRRDSIVLYALQRGLTVAQTDDLLYDAQENTLL